MQFHTFLPCLTASKREFRSGKAVGWDTLVTPRQLSLKQECSFTGGVKYVGGIENVENFFRRYPEPVILVNDLAGFDPELGFRLKCVIQSLSGRKIRLASTLDAHEVLDQPLIIIGNPQRNWFAKVLESMADDRHKVMPDNSSFIAVIENPFKYGKRSSQIANAIGFASSPACMYIAGTDDDHVKAAVYDLIYRLWADDSNMILACENARVPATGEKKASFRVNLGPGDYRVSITMGASDSYTVNKISFNSEPVEDIREMEKASGTFVYSTHTSDGVILINFDHS